MTMKLVCLVALFIALFNGLSLYVVNSKSSNFTRPSEVHIGSIFSFESIIGRVGKIAVEAAIDDVNSDPTVLAGTKLVLTMQDSNYSGFLGIVEALRFMEKDTVAIIGPQSAVTAHVVSHIANELKTPMLSFSVADPTLSPLQFPFFFRTTQNDLFQMAAIAEMVEFYEWREVIAIYVDDDNGRNGMTALGDKLAEKRCKISYKAAMRNRPSKEEITDVLVKVALTESRIIVAHINPSFGSQIFSIAKYLGMMGSGYVWIATNWLTTLIDVNYPLPLTNMAEIGGVLTLRVYTPDTEAKRNFVSRWSNLTSGKNSKGLVGMSTYALYAYDTVWLVARGINEFLDRGGKISFTNDSRLIQLGDSNLNLDAMSVFDEGDSLLQSLLHVNMTGVTGQFSFTPERNIIRPAYEIVNVVGTGTRLLGYWSNHSGLTILPPEKFYSKKPNRSSLNQRLHDAVWPGESTQKPRGWVFPNNGRHLRIGVPVRVFFREFISHESDSDSFTGYCIDVFTSALSLLPYAVPYKLIPFGDGLTHPSCTELVRLITTGVYDAAIGDIAIITNRTRMADFTQPYVESGLVVVVPVIKSNSNPWAFLKPFTREMWITTGIFFLIIGAVVWILEHRLNDDFRGPPRKQFITILWFSFSTLFFSHKENTVSTLGRLVLIIWLFVVLIITSSYTASLTSILTVEKLSSPIKGIESLVNGNDPIGYQQGSFARNYLVEELDISESRLRPLTSAAEYADSLRAGPHNGGVAAIVDERAYIELFLSTHCEFSIVGQEFTKAGWGFAFQRDSPLAIDMSTAILKLSENGDLQRIHDKWLMRSACTSQATKLEVDRLQLKSFWGLFVICGAACLLALLVYLVQIIRQFARLGRAQQSHEAQAHTQTQTHHEISSGRSLRSGRFQKFLSFVDNKDHEVVGRSRGRQLDHGSDRIDGRDKSLPNGSREAYITADMVSPRVGGCNNG